MRQVQRDALDEITTQSLAVEQNRVDQLLPGVTFNAQKDWARVRKRNWMRSKVLGALRKMAGPGKRCMYCVNSSAGQIEHFWPKATYRHKMYQWENLLLCCSECGNFKLNFFPLSHGSPLLIDPSAENPWDHLDFDPATGAITARFLSAQTGYSPRGLKTVELLQLDRREEVMEGFQRSWKRLSEIVNRVLEGEFTEAGPVLARMKLADESGLLEWCFLYGGEHEAPLRTFCEEFPALWLECKAMLVGD